MVQNGRSVAGRPSSVNILRGGLILGTAPDPPAEFVPPGITNPTMGLFGVCSEVWSLLLVGPKQG